MGQFYQLLSQVQADQGITDDELEPIRQQLAANGQLDLEDVKLLVELYCNTQNRCPGFDSLFFTVLEQVLLSDGQISPSEEYYLLKMLYSDRVIRQPERDLLRRIRPQLQTRSASFEALFESAMAASDR